MMAYLICSASALCFSLGVVSFIVLMDVLFFNVLEFIGFLDRAGLHLFPWWLRWCIQLCFVVYLLGAFWGQTLLSDRVVYNSNCADTCSLPPPSFICPGCRWYPGCFGSLPGLDICETHSLRVPSRRQHKVVSPSLLFRSCSGKRPIHLLWGWPGRRILSPGFNAYPYIRVAVGRTLLLCSSLPILLLVLL